MEMRTVFQHGLVNQRWRQLAGGAIDDIEDKIPVARCLVGDKRTSGHGIRQERNRAGIDPVQFQAVNIHPAKIIASDTGDDSARMPQLGDLIDKDRRGTARIGADQRSWLPERLPHSGGHDLDEDFPHRHYLAH